MPAVSCVEPHRTTTSSLAIPRAMDLARRWSKRWKPELYIFNVRPGMPLWLFWEWQRKGVPCVGITSRGQLQSAGEITRLVYEAWDLCSETYIFETKEQRDDACRAKGIPITTEHILHGLSPLD